MNWYTFGAIMLLIVLPSFLVRLIAALLRK
jgi:hypothetical protein